MQGVKRKVVYVSLYEGIAIVVATLGLAGMSGQDVHTAGGVAVAASVIAILWNLAFNTMFEAWEARQAVKGRSLKRRIAHAIGFEGVGSEVLVAVMAPSHPVLQATQGGSLLREQHLTTTRQVVVASRDLATTDPRFVFARHTWRTDNPVAALGLISAGLGWGWLPLSFVQPHVDSGALQVLAFENLTNRLQLWVDVVWSKERPLGLAARRFVELMAANRLSEQISSAKPQERLK